MASPRCRGIKTIHATAVGIDVAVRHIGAWDAARLQHLLDQARSIQPVPTESTAEILVDRSKRDMAERSRVLAGLDANGWRRQDTAATQGISRKV